MKAIMKGWKSLAKMHTCVKSNGTIYQVKDFLSDNPLTVKIKTYLNKENDVEGLACDPVKNCLLVGCKGKIYEGEDEQSAFKKAIYEFDLNNMVMKNGPAYMLTLPDIQEYISHIEEHGEMEKLLEDFSPKGRKIEIQPIGHCHPPHHKGNLCYLLQRQTPAGPQIRWQDHSFEKAEEKNSRPARRYLLR